MLYYLFEFLDEHFDFAGSGLFQYISFRALMTAGFSLLFAAIFGKRIIRFLQKKQVGETIRDLGLEGQMEKRGTPTMGGLIIIATILIPVFLFADLLNVYIVLLIIATVWMGLIGFIDDYIKIFKKNKEGLKGRFKIAGQIGLGIIVGVTLYYHSEVVVRDFKVDVNRQTIEQALEPSNYEDVKSTQTTIPFVKNNELDYANFVPFDFLTPVLYILIVIFIITAVSNGANITDGIDGLAAGISAIIGATLAVLAYVSGNAIFANYLNIMFIPNMGEVVIFCMAFVGACIGFMWYNSYPAQVFMGDTGSLVLGAVIAVLALVIRKELLIPLLCGVFLVENLSVMLQVGYFKYTRKKYGEGRRIFLMSPLHHHYQKKNIHEAKIVTRFWIMGLLLAIATLATLKVR
ncbi:phospho-N-acetylmuramoyl-pentapeptide-transferase [Flexithrix dorotheae]|uniref:phospho-N-acetylmuramoyl-pentapeptide- transferase n=1 Tax=Flexithrix dorotheae TaxID=70993 RepID=UPI0003609455|nr:phospho-N-acetylmuramoyl-pentapeptide-transferase [Flexithrix dorotheae]